MIVDMIDVKVSYRVSANGLMDIPDDVCEDINEACENNAFLYDGCKNQKAYDWVYNNIQESEAYDWDCIVDEINIKETK